MACKDFPDSPLTRESLAWIDVLNRAIENEERIRLFWKRTAPARTDWQLEKKNRSYEEQIRALKK
jgi:CDP-glycerol glycerophosphotransferase (TagB/SpsB family)